MAAPQIPDLGSFRRGRGQPGRGGAGITTRENEMDGSTTPRRRGPPRNKDEIIQRTDDDAATSRLSAVQTGYLVDPFAKLLSGGNNVAPRLPLMNRGTYVRTSGIDRVVDTFLDSLPSSCRKQIISLGAGSDTRFFRLKKQRPDLNIVYHEVDFGTNTQTKIARMQDAAFTNRLKEHGIHLDLSSIEAGATEVLLQDYCIHAKDLRTIGRDPIRNLKTSLPTLLISECCLIYLSPEDADAVMRYFTDLFPATCPIATVIYEPIRPDDAFGRTMVSNLIARGIHLQTLEKYSSLQLQVDRLRRFGFEASTTGSGRTAGSGANDISYIWQHWVGEEEKDRVDRLEWMDEVEEFVLLAQHYCIAWGWRAFEKASVWQMLPAQHGK